MTVISRKQQNYDYPASNNGSDTESLHLQSTASSDTESLNNEPIEPLPLSCRALRVPVYEEFGCLKRNSGKRKQRRHKNRSDLQTLSEEDEDEIQLVKLMDDYKGPFARLLQDKDALQIWYEFTALPEEEQAKLTEAVPKQAIPQNIKLDHDDPMSRLSSKIKRAMKIKKHLPMELIKKIEDDLINYFTGDPLGIIYSTPVTSFERLLLHAIAQYHNLRSISYFGDIRIVEVCVDKQLWAPMEVRFCDFVEKLRQ